MWESSPRSFGTLSERADVSGRVEWPRREAAAPSRLPGLDATRGLAMSLVCLSHFCDAYLGSVDPATDAWLRRVTLAATPAFFVTSGLLLGHLHAQQRASFDRVRRKLVDRALFLLTTARVLILAAHVPRLGLSTALATVFVTDTIACCVLVGTVLVPVVGRRARVALAAAVYLLATVLVWAWLPRSGSIGQMLKHLLVGHEPGLEQSLLAYGFPLLPWLAVYLAASALGERIAGPRRFVGGPPARLAVLGLSCVAAGLALRLARPFLTGLPGLAGGATPLTSLHQKLPPGPAYVLFYVGVALLLVALLLRAGQNRRLSGLLRVPAAVGRHSLFAFVTQYAVYYACVHVLGLGYSAWWPVLFAATLLALLLAVYAWQRAGGQQWLTVGYPGFVDRAERLLSAHGPQAALRSVA